MRKLIPGILLLMLSLNAHTQVSLLHALNFDGVDDYVLAPSKTDYNFTSGTVEAWVRPGLMVGNGCIVANRSLLFTRFSIHMSSLAVGIYNGSTYGAYPFVSVPGVWYHLSFVIDGSSTNIYVNGDLLGTVSTVINNTNSNLPLSIGIPYASSLGEKFFGDIDELRIWKTLRTPAQIKQYLYTSIDPNADLVALFHFNQGIPGGNNTGITTVTDSSPVGNMGTLTNFLRNGLVSNFVLGNGMSLASPPKITGFTPASGPIGTDVTVTGSGFSLNPANNKVLFGAVWGTVTSSTATTLHMTVPYGATYDEFAISNIETNLVGYSIRPFSTTFPGNILTVNTRYNINDVVTPSFVEYGDMDGDGKADLIVTDAGLHQVHIYRNISPTGSVSNGSFATRSTMVTGTFSAGAIVEDMDGDGKLDLITAPGTDGLLGVYLNTGTPGNLLFNPAVTVAMGLVGVAKKIETADVDNDGHAEVIILADNGIAIMRNVSLPGLLNLGVGVGFPIGPVHTDLKVVDMDGDGLQDILLINSVSSTLEIIKNISVLGIISLGVRFDMFIADLPYKLDAGDMDGDGKPDLAIVCRNNQSVNLYKNTSTPGFITLGTKQPIFTGLVSEGVVLGDLDGDNKPDMVLSNGSTKQVAYYRNQSTANTISPTSYAAPNFYATAGEPYQTFISDIDSDGRNDLTVLSPDYINVFGNTTTADVLPLELVDFVAKKNNADVDLSWTTNFEINTERFEIERSVNGGQYFRIATVAATGNSGRRINYTAKDPSPSTGNNVYRLRQVDKDGKLAYSKILNVQWSGIPRISVTLAPQPMHQYTNITIKGGENKSVLNIYSISGAMVKTYSADADAIIRISRSNMVSGTYMYQLISPKGIVLDKGKIIVD